MPPASRLAPGEALSLSREDLGDELGGDDVVVLVGDAVDDLVEDLVGETVLDLSNLDAVFKVVLAIVEPGTVDIDKLTLELAIATFISRMDGWVGREQGHPVLWLCRCDGDILSLVQKVLN